MMKFTEMMNHICRGRHPNVNDTMGRIRMYIGNEPTLTSFQAFIVGYICGAPVEESLQWHEFQQWARSKVIKNPDSYGAMGLCTLMIHKNYGDNEAGVAKLISLWREYERNDASSSESLRNPGASNEERQENQEESASYMGPESK